MPHVNLCNPYKYFLAISVSVDTLNAFVLKYRCEIMLTVKFRQKAGDTHEHERRKQNRKPGKRDSDIRQEKEVTRQFLKSAVRHAVLSP